MKCERCGFDKKIQEERELRWLRIAEKVNNQLDNLERVKKIQSLGEKGK